MPIQLSDATLIANNEVVGVVANSIKYTEGFGENKVRSMSVGGGATEQVFANDVETNVSKLMFSLPTTVANIELVRQWLANQNRNVFQIAGSTQDGDVTRTFTQATVVNDPEVGIGSEANIEVEVQANAAI